jgi:hypothetical protein
MKYFVNLGRYMGRTPKASHLCKSIRKQVITAILEKYHLIDAKVDHGKGKKKTTKKDLDAWKFRRAQGLEGWKTKKKKRYRRKVVKKKKKFQKYKVRFNNVVYKNYFKRLIF